MTDHETDPLDVDIAEAFGADGGVSTERISIYIPDKEQNDNEIGNQRKWVLEALRLLGQINGGATAMPPAEGVWLNDDGEEIQEHPVVVYSYVLSVEALVDGIPRIREFLHRMGRETNQGEIAFELAGQFLRIRQYDEE